MIDTDKYEGVTRFDLVEQHNIHELAIFLLDQFAEVKRLREQTLQLNKQLGAYMRFQLWVQGEHNEIHDSYEDVDEL